MRHASVKIEDLIPYPGNARKGNVDLIAQSLKVNGQYRPIVVQESTGFVLAGNHTMEAAKTLGWDKIEATYVDVNEEQAKRIVLVDNKSNDEADYDDAALAELLKDLKATGEGGLDGTGFDDGELSRLLDSLEPPSKGDPDNVPRYPSQPKTTHGDLIQLGDHLLMCGSSIVREDMEKLFGDRKCSLIVTSPPYNQQLDSFKPSGMQKENPAWVERMAGAYSDSQPEEDYQQEQLELLELIRDFTTENASLFYNHKHRYRDKAILSPLEWLFRSNWTVRQEVVWDRSGSITLNARMFMPQDERIYWMTKGSDFTFNDTAEIKAFGTVWRIAPRVEVAVSAPFPVELPKRCIMASSDRGEWVFDPYGGSGTTLIAAETLERRAMLMEIDPGYCDVIIERYESLTGIKAEVIE